MLLTLYFLIAVGISFLCSILEAVLLSITPSFIQVLKNRGSKTGLLLEQQKSDMDRSIGSILTLNTFAHTLGAAGVGAEAVKLFGEEYMFFISAALTILILFLSEIIPKTIGAYYYKELSAPASYLIRIFVFLTAPLLYIMQKVTALITSDRKAGVDITKDEIVATANIGEEAGVIKRNTTNVIENLLTLDTIKIKDIHTPRRVMFAISKSELFDLLDGNNEVNVDLEQFKINSRVPIYGKNIDDIIGFVLSKEFFYEYIHNELKDKEKIINPIFSINENIPVSKLLDISLNRREHIFVVVDNYDQTEGVVTLEDAIETLLGTEIVDEFDQTIDLRELAKSV